MRTQHTPGPWHWEGDTLLPKGDFDAVLFPIVTGPEDDPVGEVCFSNGMDRHLIAAAPDLLGALEAICASLAPPGHTEATVGATFGGKMQVLYRQAVAAVAKARGEEAKP